MNFFLFIHGQYEHGSGNCNIANDRLSRKGVPIKIKDVNLKVFNIIKGINQSWTYAKRISCECRYDAGEM